jgi:N-acetylglutamate synthase-like GNAT family acetyltransferase
MGVRRAVETDLEAIHPLLEQLMQTELDRRHMMWSESLEDAGYAAWIAEADGKPVGFVDLLVFPDVAHGSKIGLISNLIIDERFRGRKARRGPATRGDFPL